MWLSFSFSTAFSISTWQLKWGELARSTHLIHPPLISHPFYFCLWLFVYKVFDEILRRYKVNYPSLYASESENKDAKLFNCVQVSFLSKSWYLFLGFFLGLWFFIDSWMCYWVQRGHQNSLEMMPIFFMLMILGGLKHPCISASLGSLYIVARYFYFTGYSTGDPQNRLKIGFAFSLFLFSIFFIRQWQIKKNRMSDQISVNYSCLILLN